MNTLISIIVPVYNVRDYVSKCLGSLVKQGYESIEIIVVDDGSTDGSGEICEEYSKKDKRIKVFHKKNGGLSSARNYGIRRAKGEYICLVDSDDYVEEGFVIKMEEAAFSNDADIVVCGYNNEVPESQIMTGEEATIKLLVEQNNMEIVAWNKAYKRRLFKEISYPENYNYEDNLTTYKLLSKAKKVVYVAESLYVYRKRVGSITEKDKKEEKLLARERAAREAIKFFRSDSDLQEAARIALLTAKFAWMDFAISGEVDNSFLNQGKKWIKENKKRLLRNKYLSQKLRTYIFLTTRFDGRLYVLFRKIKHE